MLKAGLNTIALTPIFKHCRAYLKFTVCKYKTAINVHYYLPFLSTVSMSLGMSIIMSVVNSEIKWKTVIYIYLL